MKSLGQEFIAAVAFAAAGLAQAARPTSDMLAGAEGVALAGFEVTVIGSIGKRLK